MITDAQREARDNGPNGLPRMTGSMIAAAVGLSPWCSPLEQYGRCLDIMPPIKTNKPMAWGTELEAVGFTHAQELTGLMPVAPGEIEIQGRKVVDGRTILHPRPEWADSPDGVLLDSDGCVAAALEIKVPTHRTWDQWIDSETGQPCVPMQYIPQCYWHMEHCGVNACHVIVAIDYAWEHRLVEHDPEFWALLVSSVDAFYLRLLNRNEPEADGTNSAREYLLAKYPRVRHEDLDVGTVEDSLLAAEYSDTGAEIKALKETQAEAKNRLCQRIGDGPGLMCDAFIVKWTETKRGRSFRITERKDR